MSYSLSQTDKRNFNWFGNDTSCATLLAIRLSKGHMRGLYPFRLDFKYPISAIGGFNGSGKSTVLSLAACGYHNFKSGYYPAGREQNYYTFGDFFLQSREEVPPAGVEIWYHILHNNWKGNRVGPGWQVRRKRQGGRWNNYDSRVDRNVIYFGVTRVVPHYERSTSRSYRKFFKSSDASQEICDNIKKIAGRIIGKKYDGYSLHIHSKYRLPVVTRHNIHYSGLNMGAGECAVFDILTTIFEAGKGSLILIDEIELGLHVKAQSRFIAELKKLCLQFNCQIICSTHSPQILESLPPEARFFIDSTGKRTLTLNGISSSYASGILSGKNSKELDIFVEDSFAKAIMEECLSLDFRQRCEIFEVGSDEANLRQLAARFRERKHNCMAFLDGDRSSGHKTARRKIRKYLEDRFTLSGEEMDSWIDDRLKYLPGKTWPEHWILNIALNDCDLSSLSALWKAPKSHIKTSLEDALNTEKHSGLYILSESLHYDLVKIRTDIIRFVLDNHPDEFTIINDAVGAMLDDSI